MLQSMVAAENKHKHTKPNPSGKDSAADVELSQKETLVMDSSVESPTPSPHHNSLKS